MSSNVRGFRNLVEDVVDYAVGYQFRRVGVSALPNEPGDPSINPCAVPGDRTYLEKAGAFTFTTGHYDYHASQTVHRVFAETQLELGDRVNSQLTANYEFHGSVSSFDPKVAVRVELAEPLALRASVQTTFRTPSVDDLNEDRSTSLEYVSEAGIYKAVDTFGNSRLQPERALTYNLGLALQLPRLRATADYWNYDFRDVIDVLPVPGVTRLYAARGACDVSAVERIRVENTN